MEWASPLVVFAYMLLTNIHISLFGIEKKNRYMFLSPFCWEWERAGEWVVEARCWRLADRRLWRDGVGQHTGNTPWLSYRGTFQQRCYSPERAGTFKGGARTDVFVKEDRSRWPPPRRGSPAQNLNSLVLLYWCGVKLVCSESRGHALSRACTKVILGHCLLRGHRVYFV